MLSYIKMIPLTSQCGTDFKFGEMRALVSGWYSVSAGTLSLVSGEGKEVCQVKCSTVIVVCASYGFYGARAECSTKYQTVKYQKTLCQIMFTYFLITYFMMNVITYRFLCGFLCQDNIKH